MCACLMRSSVFFPSNCSWAQRHERHAFSCRRQAGCGEQMEPGFISRRDQDFRELGSGYNFTPFDVNRFIHWASELAALDFDFRRGYEPLQSLIITLGHTSFYTFQRFGARPLKSLGGFVWRQVLAFTLYMVGPQGFTEILVMRAGRFSVSA